MTYTPPTRPKAYPLLHSIAEALDLKRTIWPKAVRDALDQDIEARAAVAVARTIHTVGEVEVDAWLGRKSQHDQEQAQGDPVVLIAWVRPTSV